MMMSPRNQEQARRAKRKARLYPLLLLPVAVLLATTCERDRPAAVAADLAGTDPLPVAAPRARLRLSGAMGGRLEPCGCAKAQLGGLPRRVFYLQQDPDFDLLIEGGNLIEDGTPLSGAKMMTALTVLGMQAGYHALGLGPADLDLPLDELVPYLQAFPIEAVSSDLVAPQDLDWPVLPWIESTYRVLLVHGVPDTARAQAALEPKPDLIVGITDEIAEPPSAAEPALGVPLVFPGSRGRMLLDVTLARIDGQPRLTRYQVIRLQGSETAKGALEDPDAKLVLLDHRHQVKAEGLREKMARQLPTSNGASYVGSKECAECHEDSFAVWQDTAHAKAWATLVEAERGTRYGWPVTHYPDCVACHVVGYRYETGFVNPEQTPELLDVGCEQCHGPGSAHVESAGDEPLERSGPDTCLTCHDFEQSPDFLDHYAERWKKIEHYLDK
jgi:hypothetical protein